MPAMVVVIVVVVVVVLVGRVSESKKYTDTQTHTDRHTYLR